MTTGELAQGVGTLATKGSELQAGFDKLDGGISIMHGKLPELAGGIDALVNGMQKSMQDLTNFKLNFQN